MPPPLDLTGQLRGNLTIVQRAQSRSAKSAWLCRCNCGAELVLTVDQLREGSPRYVGSCESCRSTSCASCGAPVTPRERSRGCSPECRRNIRRAYSRAYYAKDENKAKASAARRRRHAAFTDEERAQIAAKVRTRVASMSPSERLEMFRQKNKRYIERIGRDEYNRRRRDKRRDIKNDFALDELSKMIEKMTHE